MAIKETGRIARRNCRITFQQRTVAVDQYKNHTSTWTDYFTCSAYADTQGSTTQSAQESGNAVVSEKKNVTFECRWCPELETVNSTGFRILFGEEAYNILSVDPMNYQRKTIRFACCLEKQPEGTA